MCVKNFFLILVYFYFPCSEITSNRKDRSNNNDTLLSDTIGLAYAKSGGLLEPYSYDTALRGGYSIVFAIDDSMELYLEKGKRIKQ